MNHVSLRFALALFAAVAAAGAIAQAPAEPIRGEVVAREDSMLRVRSTAGDVLAVALPGSVGISVRAPATLDAIRAGDFVATTATPQPDGTLVASELRIFAESMRGLGEGHRPMATRPGSTMTNATVASVASARAKPADTMTNATVAGVAGTGDGRTLRLVYPGGEQTVVVPASTPIARVEQGDIASLAPGAHVIVYAVHAADGTLSARRITVGKNGSVPQG